MSNYDIFANMFLIEINNIVNMSREQLRMQAIKKLESRESKPMKRKKSTKKKKSKGKKSCH